MALSIENGQIVGTIDKLEEKLEGKLPINRLCITNYRHELPI